MNIILSIIVGCIVIACLLKYNKHTIASCLAICILAEVCAFFIKKHLIPGFLISYFTTGYIVSLLESVIIAKAAAKSTRELRKKFFVLKNVRGDEIPESLKEQWKSYVKQHGPSADSLVYSFDMIICWMMTWPVLLLLKLIAIAPSIKNTITSIHNTVIKVVFDNSNE